MAVAVEVCWLGSYWVWVGDRVMERMTWMLGFVGGGRMERFVVGSWVGLGCGSDIYCCSNPCLVSGVTWD